MMCINVFLPEIVQIVRGFNFFYVTAQENVGANKEPCRGIGNGWITQYIIGIGDRSFYKCITFNLISDNIILLNNYYYNLIIAELTCAMHNY